MSASLSAERRRRMLITALGADIAAAMGLATSHLGIVATLSTMAYPPFMTARLASTMDSLLEGRFGWNIVTSAEDLAPPRQ